jgi:hypothetical protein
LLQYVNFNLRSHRLVYYRQLQKSKLRVKFWPKGGGGALGHGHRVD